VSGNTLPTIEGVAAKLAAPRADLAVFAPDEVRTVFAELAIEMHRAETAEVLLKMHTEDAATDYASVCRDIIDLTTLATKLLDAIKPWQALPANGSTIATTLALVVAQLPRYEKYATPRDAGITDFANSILGAT